MDMLLGVLSALTCRVDCHSYQSMVTRNHQILRFVSFSISHMCIAGSDGSSIRCRRRSFATDSAACFIALTFGEELVRVHLAVVHRCWTGHSVMTYPSIWKIKDSAIKLAWSVSKLADAERRTCSRISSVVRSHNCPTLTAMCRCWKKGFEHCPRPQ